ncbi:MAG: hypothetical protein IPL74_15365 [Bacteroidetes bacterium]|nr:hypothetical protein [Bacteroidota bacterium]
MIRKNFSQVEKYKKLTQKYNKDGDLKNLYMRIGTVYNQAMNFIGAKDYYLQALNIIKGSNVESEMPGGISYDIINSKLSDIYYSLGQYDSSIYFIRNTIKSNQAGSEILNHLLGKTMDMLIIESAHVI